MQKLNRGAEIAAAIALVAERAADEDQKCRAHALAACTRDVIADFMHAAHVAREFVADHVVDRFHVERNGGEKPAHERLRVFGRRGLSHSAWLLPVFRYPANIG